MKFRCIRTSDWSGGSPCEGAFSEDRVFKLETGKEISTKIWFVEIGSFEEFIEFVKLHKVVIVGVVYEDEKELQLEIYSDTGLEVR